MLDKHKRPTRFVGFKLLSKDASHGPVTLARTRDEVCENIDTRDFDGTARSGRAWARL